MPPSSSSDLPPRAIWAAAFVAGALAWFVVNATPSDGQSAEILARPMTSQFVRWAVSWLGRYGDWVTVGLAGIAVFATATGFLRRPGR